MNGEWKMEACPEPRRRDGGWLLRLRDELAQAWTVAVKDVKVYYLKPGMIMLGFMTPFFLFFSFSVRREMGAAQGVARLLALTVFFTAAAAGPFIIPLERRLGTYDRLLAAPMSLLTLLLGKASVGAFFAIVVSAVALTVGVVAFGVSIGQPWLLVASVLLGSFSFSALGLIFGSIPTHNPGEVQMPSLLLRWGLLFISGVFIPLAEMAPAARAVATISPLTYAQDLMNHAVLGAGLLSPWLDLAMLLLGGVLFLIPSMLMHHRSRKLGY
jgi:ABC-2 type transport system permease protein